MKECGAACLATVLKQHGMKTSLTKIREVAGTDKKGTNVFGMVKAAERLGFSAKAIRGTKENFFQQFPLPAIAHIVLDQSLLHYVVIHSVSKNTIIVADPAQGIMKYTPEQFFNVWTGILILMVPSQSLDKSGNTKGSFGRFFSLLLPHRKTLVLIFFVSMLYTLVGILGAFYFKMLLDEILPYAMEKTLHVISIGVIALAVFKIILTLFRSYLLLKLSQKLDIALILGYYRHVLKLPMHFFSSRQTGEIIARLMDASKVREAISGAALTIMIDVLMVITGGIILYMQSSFLFGVTFTLIPLYVITVWLFHKPFERMNRNQMESSATLTSYLVETINGVETLKAYTAEKKADFQTEKKFIVLLKNIFKLGFWNNIQGTMKGLLQTVGGIVILWIGAVQVLKGELTMGQLITFNALLVYFLDPIQNLINMQSSVQTAIVAAERLGEVLDLQPEKNENEEKKIMAESLHGDIEYKNIDFRYGTRELILKDISLKVRKGEKIAFVGESGSGKTTLVKLLLRLYEMDKGEISIDDNNILDINMDVLRNRISYISQETFFFSGTVLENLMLGVDETNTPMERVIEASKLAQTHEFINKLPLRYDTMLEENAFNLSGGQRQRLAITRALLKNPDILILDEATSNLDTTTERAVSDVINRMENTTTLIIAHRLSTIMRCDRIYVMGEGKILEFGNHKELLEQKGKYYSLWRDQLDESGSSFLEKAVTYGVS